MYLSIDKYLFFELKMEKFPLFKLNPLVIYQIIT